MAGEYPLEAARTVRAVARQEAERALASRRDELARATAALSTAREALAEARCEEAERLARAPAPVRAAELLREERYRDAVWAREAERVAVLEGAARAVGKAERALERARGALGGAVTDEKVLDRHRSRWADERAKSKEKRLEDELEDQNLSRT